MIQTGSKHGMILMDDSLFNHWRAERITMEDALAKAQNPNDLAKRIADARRGLVEDRTDVA